METFDFLVVGAGIAGASAACELARHGRVGVLEREGQAGYHSTGRSTALYSQAYGNAAIRALTAGSRAFLTEPPEGFAEHPLLTPRGAMFVGDESQRGLLEKLARDAERTVAGIERFDGAEARALVPVLRPERLGAAVLEPHAMDVDDHALLQGVLRGFRTREPSPPLSSSTRPAPDATRSPGWPGYDPSD